MADDVCWAAEWKCPDCGHTQPIAPGENTLPISRAHECDSIKLAVHQAELSGWEDGYRYALANLDDELVQADKESFGTGWMRLIRRGGVVIDVGDEEAPVNPRARGYSMVELDADDVGEPTP